MAKNTYSAKVKFPGCWFWKTIKGIVGDGIERDFRYIHLEDDTMIHFPYSTPIIWHPDRMKFIEKQMSKEAGQPVQRT